MGTAQNKIYFSRPANNTQWFGQTLIGYTCHVAIEKSWLIELLYYSCDIKRPIRAIW